MKSFWKVVNNVIDKSDIVLEVLDARFIEETRNKEIETKLKRQGKTIIYIINKSDLLKEKITNINVDLEPHIFISAKDNLGTTKLRSLLRKYIVDDEPLYVGVMGYPNTGKSSLINCLRQKKVTKVSSTPGQTRGLQKIRISKNIYLLDTPGVFPYKEEGDDRQALINVRDYRKIKEPEHVALEIIDKAIIKDPKIIEELYGVKPSKDNEETLENIAIKFNWLIKGGKPNIDQTSRKIIRDWQRGILVV